MCVSEPDECVCSGPVDVTLPCVFVNNLQEACVSLARQRCNTHIFIIMIQCTSHFRARQVMTERGQTMTNTHPDDLGSSLMNSMYSSGGT